MYDKIKKKKKKMKKSELKQIIKEEIQKILKEGNVFPMWEEDASAPKYYAIFNIYLEFNNGKPLYIIANTKEEMLNKLNKAYLEITGEKRAPYSLKDLNPITVNGKVYPHFISDDWSMVTDNESVFKSDIENVGVEPVEYTGLQ